MGVPFRGKVDRTVSDTTFVVWYSGAWCVLEAEAMNLCAGDDLEADWHAFGPQQIVIKSPDARRRLGKYTFAGNIVDTQCRRDQAITIARDRVIIRSQLPPFLS